MITQSKDGWLNKGTDQSVSYIDHNATWKYEL